MRVLRDNGAAWPTGYVIVATVLSLLVPVSAWAQERNPQVVMDTSLGSIRLELFADKAPVSVRNFLRYVDDKFYDGTVFHRVIADFMIQGGCPEGSGRGGPGYTFADESDAGLKHSKPGLLSMANRGPNTNGSQFFVTVAATPWLDNKHSIFGEIVEGYDVVKKISETPRSAQDRPLKEVKVHSVKIERT